MIILLAIGLATAMYVCEVQHQELVKLRRDLQGQRFNEVVKNIVK